MKTPSGFVAFIVIAVITTLVVVGCCNFPFLPNIVSYSVNIGGTGKSPTAPIYVEWKDQKAFDSALARLRGNPRGNGKVCICVLEHPGATAYRHKLSNDCKEYEDRCPSEKISTVKIAKAKVAYNVATAESAANDPNITYRIQSADPNDISAVLDTLKH